ncbi:class I SAM-dependent methyltransferase [Saccharothrix saharensis]|uniref:class I SAM-dependent methyltransferase n=1 Tax=Saccharothrix saharensis TaxID=571190 RepID=UPI0036823063
MSLLSYTGVGSIVLTAAALLKYGVDTLGSRTAGGGPPTRGPDPQSRTGAHGHAEGTRDEEPMDDEDPIRTPEDFDRVWARVEAIEDGLSEDDGAVLHRAACHVLTTLPNDPALVEVGSRGGRSTVVLASAMRALRPSDMLVSIDPQDRQRPDRGHITPGTAGREGFRTSLVDARLLDWVEVVRGRSADAVQGRRIGLLLLNSLHDRVRIREDFDRLGPSVAPGGLVVLHDHRPDRWLDVVRFVDELDEDDRFDPVTVTGTVVVLRRRP